VIDAIGGRPTLVRDGATAAAGGTFTCPATPDNLCKAQPRTVVAVTQPCVTGTAGCKVMLVVVDGRQPGWSKGMKINGLVKFLIGRLHAYAALNLDGGGSTTMYTASTGPWCKSPVTTGGCLVNSPAPPTSPGGERLVPSALMLLPGADGSDPAL
jgi:hypothetical protein